MAHGDFTTANTWVMKAYVCVINLHLAINIHFTMNMLNLRTLKLVNDGYIYLMVM